MIMDLNTINEYLQDKSPGEIVAWALETANRP